MIDLDELRDSAQKAFPADVLMPARDAGWQTIVDLGWLLIELDEADGGLGLGAAASATIVFEQGRVLSRAPLIPALAGLRAIAASAALHDRTLWIDRICGGAYVPCNLLPSIITVAADGTLAGTISGVLDADMAQHIVAVSPSIALLVPLDAPGVTVIEQPLWDESRRMFDITLEGLIADPAFILARDNAACALHDRVASALLLALSADALGGATALLDMTVNYLLLRTQFDRPLAMFQALKHRVADCKIQLAAAQALLWARAGQPHLGIVDAGALKALATEAGAAIAEEAIQLHGGIGLTQEHPCHRFLKRAFLNRALCGSADHWHEQAGRAALAHITA